MKILCLLTLLILTSGLLVAERPNFLFIFADDQSYETIAVHGNDEIYTPNLDRLAESGVSFMNAYNMGGWTGAVCVPSRTMMITGRTVWRARDSEAHLDEYAKRKELWPQLLGQAGYETYFTGKWHIQIDPDAVFDHLVNERPGMPQDSWITMLQNRENPTLETVYSFPEYNRPSKHQPDAWLPYEKSFGGYWEGGKHWSEVLTDDATAFLEHASVSDNPFFMYLAFNAPHDPRQSPKRFVDMYPVEQIKVPISYLPEYPYKDAIGASALLRDEALAPFPRTEYAVKVHRQEYYAIITHMDEQIGRILMALEKTGMRENTYILFAADHGLACGNHGFLGKQNMYEHSMKVPLIVAGPNVPANERREALVYLQDIMATTLDLAGLDKPTYVEFNSLMPLIASAGEKSVYESIYGCYLATKQRMIRKGDMKLIVYPEAKRVRLFNLRMDPQEIDDLSSNPAEWPTVRRLFAELVEKQKKLDDDLDLFTYFPELMGPVP